ncbi:MAG: bifunctional 3-hydroxydecanoyl-ACP dehydratase/trans-2-decenoyl-ACP isomerase [Desulfobacteraceae bacterium]|nr:bifunctional 3-hydroxydecanoyl-ACP dehydratase/trans-2-decenoyl-ACP isomerase [Desulfobacteraceae bacterium]
MKYHEFLTQSQFDFESLLAFSYGRLIEDPPEGFDARLPAPPFLMVDRILSITKKGSRGRVVAEQDIRLDAWYFQCHFPGDPVQPGCLCVDAVWQLLGFYCVWCGALGAGRALGCGDIAFTGQIRPHNRVARFEIDILRFQELKQAGSSIVIGDAAVFIDNEPITTVKGARTGVFKGITYKEYPLRTPNFLGGAATS